MISLGVRREDFKDYLDYNFRFTTSGLSNYFEDNSSNAGLLTKSLPEKQIPYFDWQHNNYLTFVEFTTDIELSPQDIIDPLGKYRKLAEKIDFSEIGTEKELLEEEIKDYFNHSKYRRRATTLLIDGEEIGI